jgi:hypothetical protein
MIGINVHALISRAAAVGCSLLDKGDRRRGRRPGQYQHSLRTAQHWLGPLQRVYVSSDQFSECLRMELVRSHVRAA